MILRALLIAIIAALFVWVLAHALEEQPEPPIEVRVEDVRPAWTPTHPATTTTLPPTTTTARHVRVIPKARTAPSERCGGDLPPCWVMERESGGDIHAYNPDGCVERDSAGNVKHQGCRGKWQCSYSTCSGTGTEAEQDAEARRIWNGGKGCSHWNACERSAA